MRALRRRIRRFRYFCALALLGAVTLIQCSSSDEKDTARECCTCVTHSQCWDFDQCSSNSDCVCALLGNACSRDPPCVAIDDECVENACKAQCDRFF